MPRSTEVFEYTYLTLAELTGQDYTTIRQHKSRGKFTPERMESVMVYLARFAVPELRQAMIDYAIDHTGLAPNNGVDALKAAKRRQKQRPESK